MPYAEDYSMDCDALKQAINSRTKAIFICNPNNPGGKSLTHQEVEYISNLTIEHDLLLISDEVYRKIIYDDTIHYSVGSIPEIRDRAILIDSFSKTYAMTGWRIGYAAATPELLEPMNTVRKAGASSVGVPTQRAAWWCSRF